jgi:hypothetical protein
MFYAQKNYAGNYFLLIRFYICFESPTHRRRNRQNHSHCSCNGNAPTRAQAEALIEIVVSIATLVRRADLC